MNNFQKAFTLIELVIFIALLGLSVVALFSLIYIPQHIHRLDQQTVATELAQQRTEIILGQRYINGFASFTDPCGQSSIPPGYASACTLPTGYSIASPTIIPLGTSQKRINVTVGGPGNATLQTIVTDY